MRKKGEILYILSFLVSDILAILFSFYIAYWVRFHSGLMNIPLLVPSIVYYMQSAVIVSAVWVFVFYLFNLYTTERIYTLSEDIYRALKGSFLGSCIILAVTFFFRPFAYSRFVFLLGCFLSLILISIGRFTVWKIKISMFKRGHFLKRVALVGNGDLTKSLCENIEKKHDIGFKFIGQISEKRSNGPNYLGTAKEINEIIEKNNIDTLLITIPIHSQYKVSKIISRCKNLPVDFLFVPDLYEMITNKVHFLELNGTPLIQLVKVPITQTYKIAKRSIDMFSSLLILMLSTPLIAIISFLIRVSSNGPVFYKQKRVGKDGKIFTLYKFRTMVHEAEDETGPIWAEKNDNRVIPIGRILRKTRLDEIPQFLNILKGEMSIVGPRPERPFFVGKLKRRFPDYMERLKVKPGLTGLAQVDHKYDTLLKDVKKKLEYDLIYINNISLLLDFKVLFKTIPVVLKGQGAH